jgi:hypothetical protein
VSIVVFLGPTLPHAEARAHLDATYLPPVQMGDVWAAMRLAPRAIVIIDGVFERTPAVWHKEILYALSRGVRVFGSSSMGALRAAELAAFGMEGVGRVFEMVRDGELEDDDEVAVAHAPEEHGFGAFSDAMVNIRYGLECAVSEGLISTASRAALVRAAKATFYGERRWSTLLAPGAVPGVPAHELEQLARFVRETRPNLKRRDAIELLERVRALGADMPCHTPSFVFETSWTWRKLVDQETRVARCALPAAVLGRQVRATVRDREEILARAAVLSLAAAELERRTGSEPASEAALWQAARLTASEDRDRVNRFVAMELARNGTLDDFADAVTRTLRRDPGTSDEDAARARAWYEARFGEVIGDLDEHAGSLGFPSWSSLLEELVRGMYRDHSLPSTPSR